MSDRVLLLSSTKLSGRISSPPCQTVLFGIDGQVPTPSYKASGPKPEFSFTADELAKQ